MVHKKFYRAAIIPIFLAVCAPVLSACQTPPPALSPQEEAAILTVTGSATYRERMAAPKGSVLKVELSGTSRAGAPTISLADWSDSLDDGGVPKKFTLRLNEPLDPRVTYTLRATSTGPEGALLWTTDTVHRISDVAGKVDAGTLVMVKVQPAATPAAPEVSGNGYTVTAIGGAPVKGTRPLTITFGEDGRVGGFGGCNSYGGSFKETNGKLTFGDLISTMMACIDGGISAQENALYATLKGTVKVAPGADGKVTLTGENGTVLELTPEGEVQLAGTSWLVETMGGTAIVAGSEPQITFTSNGQVNGTTGCNRFFGGYTQSGGDVTFSGVGMTKMACLNDGIMAQEIAFTNILSGKTKATIDGLGNLVIKGEDGISFTARPLPTEEDIVEGSGAWTVEDINRAGIIDNTVLTLTFTENGRVTGSTGCNSLSGAFIATGTTITFSPLITTRRACVAPALNAQEARFTSALQGEMSWRITADGALELTREGGHRVLLRR